jgi:hypothetical protein
MMGHVQPPPPTKFEDGKTTIFRNVEWYIQSTRYQMTEFRTLAFASGVSRYGEYLKK